MGEATGHLLIVDDEQQVREFLGRLMQEEGYETELASSGDEAVRKVERSLPDAVLLDVMMPGSDGMQTLLSLKEIEPNLPVVMVTALGNTKDAVEAMRRGATDYITKPFEHAEVLGAVRRAMKEQALRRRIAVLTEQAGSCTELKEMMGPSQHVTKIDREVRRVAPSDFTVLLIGETGTGKELVARAIHGMSRRAEGSFVAVDCGAIPESLFESELFGHEKGSFTGAHQQRAGKFELAAGGTLFLDEVANLPQSCQAKLLRAIQEKRISPVGATKTKPVDVRIVAAANERLSDRVEQGDFRRDLYYRLNEFLVEIPSLRERTDDVLYLAKRFLDLTNHELGKRISGFDDQAVERLLMYEWPGNVRQLRSVIRRAVLLADDRVEARHLECIRTAGTDEPSRGPRPDSEEVVPLKELVRNATRSLEKAALVRVLSRTGGNKAKAARLLRIDYKTMYTKVREYRIGQNGG